MGCVKVLYHLRKTWPLLRYSTFHKVVDYFKVPSQKVVVDYFKVQYNLRNMLWTILRYCLRIFLEGLKVIIKNPSRLFLLDEFRTRSGPDTKVVCYTWRLSRSKVLFIARMQFVCVGTGVHMARFSVPFVFTSGWSVTTQKSGSSA